MARIILLAAVLLSGCTSWHYGHQVPLDDKQQQRIFAAWVEEVERDRIFSPRETVVVTRLLSAKSLGEKLLAFLRAKGIPLKVVDNEEKMKAESGLHAGYIVSPLNGEKHILSQLVVGERQWNQFYYLDNDGALILQSRSRSDKS